MIPYSKKSYQLLHEGVQALSIVEANGLKIDEVYLDSAIRKTRRDIERLQERQKESKTFRIWKRTFGRKTNLESNDQLGTILFEKLEHDPIAYTPTGKPKTDEKSLTAIDSPFVKNYLKIKKLRKALSTYLIGIKREVADGFLHPSFNLHTTVSYRSSSQNPNFQNMPIRNPEIGELVRTAFIARQGRRLVEIDYGGIEVCVAACYHKDPSMISYIEDKTKDMHRDMAMECYKLSQDQVTKEIRYCGKNMFVFPQFYGDWYITCAQSLWEAMDIMKLKTADGVPLKKHLREKGIKKLGNLDPKEEPSSNSFERHIRNVEKAFWNKRFPVYSKWKKWWTEKYQKRGWMITKTGFICQGHLERNKIINLPVQGSAFHCLLKSLIVIVLRELKKRKMKTMIVGQIHDSIVADVPNEELQEFLCMSNSIMTKKLRKNWPWIIVPLEIEAEISPIEGNWFMKKEWIEENGVWREK